MNHASGLLNVVTGGFCIGCGACSVATDGAVQVKSNDFGLFVADLSRVGSQDLASGARACPFADDSLNEDELARRLFPKAPANDPVLGAYESIRVGRVVDESFLQGSSSGGVTTWLLTELLDRQLVDGVIHVGASSDGRFAYRVSSTRADVMASRKSAYCATTLVDCLQTVRGDGRRYAIVGVPCFAKAVRLLCVEDPVLAEQLRYVIGLVCGHMKSRAFGELLAWQMGISPADLRTIDFRVKQPTSAATDYSVTATAGNGNEVSRPAAGLLGTDWGLALFQPRACEFCDDIFAEVADVTFGDAWLPEFISDPRGTNLIVSRHQGIDSILAEGCLSGALDLEVLSAALAIESQAGNVRYRRVALAMRLQGVSGRGEWAPRKRTFGGPSLPLLRRRTLRLRQSIAAQSHQVFLEAKRRDSLEVFTVWLQRQQRTYRLLAKLERILRSLTRH